MSKEKEKFNPYSEITHPDKEDVYEIDSSGEKQPKTAKRTEKEEWALERLRHKDPERYKKIWDQAREKAAEVLEGKTGRGLSAKEHGEKLNEIQKKEALKLAEQQLDYLEKIGK